MSYASSITPNYSYWACTTTATSSCAIIIMFYSCPRNLPCSNPVLCSKLLRANHERTNAVNGRIHIGLLKSRSEFAVVPPMCMCLLWRSYFGCLSLSFCERNLCSEAVSCISKSVCMSERERARKRHDLIGCEKAETVCDAFIGHDRVVRHSVVLEGHSTHELVT